MDEAKCSDEKKPRLEVDEAKSSGEKKPRFEVILQKYSLIF
jgi:hypothetical protein